VGDTVAPRYVVIGRYSAGGSLSLTPTNPSGATPMISADTLLTWSRRPITPRSPPNSDCQNAWPSTTTSAPRGVVSSAAVVKNRPIAGRAAKKSQNEALTAATRRSLAASPTPTARLGVVNAA
jgi:hypothetical protein